MIETGGEEAANQSALKLCWEWEEQDRWYEAGLGQARLYNLCVTIENLKAV